MGRIPWKQMTMENQFTVVISNFNLFLLFIIWEHFCNINHYQQLSSNMASQLENENCCVKHCWGVCEQNSIVNLCSCRWLDSRKGDHYQWFFHRIFCNARMMIRNMFILNLYHRLQVFLCFILALHKGLVKTSSYFKCQSNLVWTNTEFRKAKIRF